MTPNGTAWLLIMALLLFAMLVLASCAGAEGSHSIVVNRQCVLFCRGDVRTVPDDPPTPPPSTVNRRQVRR